MKMMDCVEITLEKSEYSKEGVHKGMQGWICLEEKSNGYWLVNFPQLGEKEDIATISVKENDLKLIPKMDASINEKIKAIFEDWRKSCFLFKILTKGGFVLKFLYKQTLRGCYYETIFITKR